MRLAGRITIAAVALSCGGLFGVQAGDSSSAPSAKRSTVPPAAARQANGGKKEAKIRRPLTITPEREAAVLTFVERNHAELADLLGYLKSSQPEEYERAVKEIFRTTERLEAIRQRDPVQYELEVAVWTAQSRVQLLAAKLKMNSSDELLKELREALTGQNDARLALLKHERQKVADRLTKIEADIARYGANGESVVERQLKLLVRTAGEGRPKANGKAAKRNTP